MLPVCGIVASRVRAGSYVEITIQSRLSDSKVNLVFHVLPTIVDTLLSCEMPKGGWKIKKEPILKLVHPSFHNLGTVYLLTGGGVFFDVTATAVFPSTIECE